MNFDSGWHEDNDGDNRSPAEETFNSWRQTILRGVEVVGSDMKNENDDWQPLAFFLYEKNISVCPLVEFFREGERAPQHKVIPALTTIFRHQGRPRLAALVTSVWTKVINTADHESMEAAQAEARHIHEQGVRNAPGRKEYVFVELCDGTIDELWQAEIIRIKDAPPFLAPWERMFRDPPDDNIPPTQQLISRGPAGQMLLQAYQQAKR